MQCRKLRGVVKRKRARGLRIAVCLVVAQVAVGAAADVEPGQIVTHEMRERVRDLFPPEVYAAAVEGFEGLQLTIVPSEHYAPHPKYVEATVKYACQATVDEHGQLQGYTAGQPFPYSDWAREATHHACDLSPDDPQFALKLAWNVNYRWMGAGTLTYPHWGQSYARSGGEDTWRLAQGSYRRSYFSHRADLLPDATGIEPEPRIEWAEMTEMLDPFDIRGQRVLIYRYDDSHRKRDDAWVYVPEDRKVRRLSTGEKSDSVLGSEITYEDFFLFSGYVWDQDWHFGGEHVYLAALDTQRSCFPKNVPGWQPDRLAALGSREQFDACRFGPFHTLPLVDERWQKRTVVQLEQVPHLRGHPYSRKLLWYDKETFAPLLFFAYGRDGKPLKLSWYIQDWSETSDVPGNRGKHALFPVAVLLVNFSEGTTNRSLFFTANLRDFSAAEILDYYDVTRLKRGH
jgi:hypothetical protein